MPPSAANVRHMNSVLWIALGGAVGASSRHLIGLWAMRMFGSGLPWGTLIVNIAGSFAMGVFIEYLALRLQGSTELRLLIATGFLGGFTTFSAFSLEFALMWERGEIWWAAGYAIFSVVLSVSALFFGLWIVRTALT